MTEEFSHTYPGNCESESSKIDWEKQIYISCETASELTRLCLTPRDLKLGTLSLRAVVRTSSLPVYQRYTFEELTSADIIYILDLFNKRNGREEIRWTTRETVLELFKAEEVISHFEGMTL